MLTGWPRRRFSESYAVRISVKISQICEFRVIMGIMTSLLGCCSSSTLGFWLHHSHCSLGCWTNNTLAARSLSPNYNPKNKITAMHCNRALHSGGHNWDYYPGVQSHTRTSKLLLHHTNKIMQYEICETQEFVLYYSMCRKLQDWVFHSCPMYRTPPRPACTPLTWFMLTAQCIITVTSHGHHGMSNHWQLGYLLNSLFRLTWKKTSKPFVRGTHW